MQRPMKRKLRLTALLAAVSMTTLATGRVRKIPIGIAISRTRIVEVTVSWMCSRVAVRMTSVFSRRCSPLLSSWLLT